MDGQGEDLGRCSFRLGQRQVVAQFARVIGLLVDEQRVVDTRADALLLEEIGQPIPASVGNPDGVLMEDVATTSGHARRFDTLETLGKRGSVGLTGLVEPLQFAQLSEADGGVDIGHAEVVAQFLVKVALPHAMLTKPPAFGREPLVMGGDHAPLGGGDILGRVEGEAACAEGTHPTALVGGSMGLAGILDHSQIVSAGYGEDRVHLAGQAVEMHGQERHGTGRDGRLDLDGIDVEGHGVDIDKDWSSGPGR